MGRRGRSLISAGQLCPSQVFSLWKMEWEPLLAGSTQGKTWLWQQQCCWYQRWVTFLGCSTQSSQAPCMTNCHFSNREAGRGAVQSHVFSSQPFGVLPLCTLQHSTSSSMPSSSCAMLDSKSSQCCWIFPQRPQVLPADDLFGLSSRNRQQLCKALEGRELLCPPQSPACLGLSCCWGQPLSPAAPARPGWGEGTGVPFPPHQVMHIAHLQPALYFLASANRGFQFPGVLLKSDCSGWLRMLPLVYLIFLFFPFALPSPFLHQQRV